MLRLMIVLTALGTMALVGMSAHAAPILSVVGGQLVGASGVSVDGMLYDVEFMDGTCIELFTGCDSPSDFTFTSAESATLASIALRDFVFVGVYDTDPTLTNGIVSSPAIILTPYGFTLDTNWVNSTLTYNDTTLLDDFLFTLIEVNPVYNTADILSEHDLVYARWAPAQVPEPATLALLGAGLLGLGVSRRQSRKPASIQ